MFNSLQQDVERLETFDSELSSLQSWISDAVHSIDTANKSLASVPPSNEELDNVTKVLSVRCVIYVCPSAIFHTLKNRTLNHKFDGVFPCTQLFVAWCELDC